MLMIFKQPAQDSQEYYGNLKACFTEYQGQIAEIEEELRIEQDRPNCLQDPTIARIDYLVSFIRCLKIYFPLFNASILMLMEHCPVMIDKVSRDLADEKPLSSSKQILIGRQELFEILCLFNPTKRKRIIQNLSCSYKDKCDILDALADNCYEDFSRIYKEICDFSALSQFFGDILCLQYKSSLIQVLINILIKKMNNVDHSIDEKHFEDLLRDYRCHNLQEYELSYIFNINFDLHIADSNGHKPDDIGFYLSMAQSLQSINELSLVTFMNTMSDLELDQTECKLFGPIREAMYLDGLYGRNGESIRNTEDSINHLLQDIAKQNPMPGNGQKCSQAVGPTYVTETGLSQGSNLEIIKGRYDRASEIPVEPVTAVKSELEGKNAVLNSERPKGGAPRKIWYKKEILGEYIQSIRDYQEEALDDYISKTLETEVWNGIRLDMDELVMFHNGNGGLSQNLSVDTKEQYIRSLGAAMILCIAQTMGFADTNIVKCTDPMARTLHFLSPKSSVDPYLDVLQNVFLYYYVRKKVLDLGTRDLDLFKQKAEQLASSICKNGAGKPHVVCILYNYRELVRIYNNGCYLFAQAFYMKTNLKWIPKPEKADQAILRAMLEGNRL